MGSSLLKSKLYFICVGGKFTLPDGVKSLNIDFDKSEVNLINVLGTISA